MTLLNQNRVFSDHGMIKDVELNLLKICKESFEEDEFLRHSPLYPKEFVDTDVTRVNLQELPVLYAWCSNMREDFNSTGALGSRKTRETLIFTCHVRMITDYALPKEGEDDLREIGWHLREKIGENMNLNGISNLDPRIIGLDFEPDLQMVEGRLAPVSGVNITLEYKVVRKRVRVTK